MLERLRLTEVRGLADLVQRRAHDLVADLVERRTFNLVPDLAMRHVTEVVRAGDDHGVR